MFSEDHLPKTRKHLTEENMEQEMEFFSALYHVGQYKPPGIGYEMACTQSATRSLGERGVRRVN